MKTFVSALLVLTLTLLAVPALAQSNQQAGTVTKTFQLTINGAVPAGAATDSFGVLYGYQTPAGENSTGEIVFCGPRPDLPRPNCSGNGTVYTEGVAVPTGSVVTFSFYRATEEQARSIRTSALKSSSRVRNP